MVFIRLKNPLVKNSGSYSDSHWTTVLILYDWGGKVCHTFLLYFKYDVLKKYYLLGYSVWVLIYIY